MKIQELYNKYLQKPINKRFKISDVQSVLQKDYAAYPIEINSIDFLMKSDEVALYDKCFIIDNKKVLENVFTEQEKEDFLSLIETNNEYPLDLATATKSETEYQRIQEGEYVVIFLGTDDHENVTHFHLIGNSELLFHQLVVFIGVTSEECKVGSRKFHDYLEALSYLGYLI